jgi:acetyl esterase/lipase
MGAGDGRSGGLLGALALLARPATFEAMEPTHADVRYGNARRSGIAPLCDVYLPEGPGPHPSVVVVHGGGFLIGHRRMKPVRLVATRLCRAGFAVCSVDYRLLFRGGALDAQLGDVTAAADFWRAEHARFRCDPERVSMLGFSAGAALMLLHAGSSAHAYHRLVNIYGALDFHEMAGPAKELLVRMLLGTGDRRVWAQRSPSAHAHMASPLLTIHGTRDALVPVHHATRLHEARRARGLPSELELVEGMPHAWLNDASLPETERALERVLSFLRG